ncbi:MAG: EmrA/EmrK family multidrug efflux transporter periplasmic adaptor subunit, partial [Paraburkholderia sp.]
MSDTTIERTTAQAKPREQVEQAEQTEQADPPKRKLMLTLLAAAIAVSGAAYGAYYFTIGRFHQSTDDAYVSGNLVQLTPQVSGTVVAVNADDTQIVKQG